MTYINWKLAKTIYKLIKQFSKVFIYFQKISCQKSIFKLVPNLPAQFWAFFQILEHEKLDLGIESQHNRLINLYIVFCKLLDDITPFCK